MKKELLIKEIELLSDARIRDICTTGVIYKVNLKSYSFTNKMLLNNKKLKKVYIDLKYRGYVYIPF